MQLSVFLLILMGQSSFFTCHLYVYHFIGEKKTWDEAQKYCRENYTDLATVSDMTDMERLCNSTKDNGEAWIGLYNKTNVNRMWHWSLPGLEFHENKAIWSSGEPNDKPFPENCGFIHANLSWGDVSCNERSYFLCYDERNPSSKFFLYKKSKTWLQAQSYCREHHTDLVSGQNQLEDVELTKKISSINTWMVFGLFRDTWGWSDGSNYSFRYWDDSFVDSQPDDESCVVAMLNKNSRWKKDNCNATKPFFCYDNNLILIQENKTWVEALNYCREKHYDLVSITDFKEQRWVQETVKNASTDYVWLGLRYTCTLDFWFWVSDETVSYENWGSDVKSDDCDMSAVMETGGENHWFKTHDNETFNFICSKF